MLDGWKRLPETKVVTVGYRTLVIKNFALPDGKKTEFTTVDKEGARYAGCIALTTDNKVIAVKQFRSGPERIMYEMPGGGVEAGEEPLEAAKRELLEESGYQAGNIVKLGDVCKDAYTNAIHSFFLATDCQKVSELQTDEHEYIEVELITIEQLLENTKNVRMTDSEAVLLGYEKLIAMQKG